jgi:hypothetical protein
MKKFLTGIAAAGLLFSALNVSNALTQFAVLNPVPIPPGPVTPYHFDNASATFGVTPIVLPVTFQFLVPGVPTVGNNVIDAFLTISAEANGPFIPDNQPLKNLVFAVVPQNAGDVFGAGILLRTVVPNPVDFPDGTLADLFSVGNLGFLGSEFINGLIMESSYLAIDPTENQTATWSFSNVIPPGGFAAGANGFLRDTELQGNANFAATVVVGVPEPGSVALLIGFGVGGSLALIRRRRNR